MASKPPSSANLARTLPTDPTRDAAHATRGFEWQRWMTGMAWLDLAAGEALWIEWGEDLTVATTGGVRTIQAKNRAGKVTLGTKPASEAISRAILRDNKVQSVLWATATPGLEKGDPFGEPGIRHWARVAAGEVPPDKLRAFLLRKDALSAAAAARVKTCDDDQLRAVLAQIIWITEQPELTEVQDRVRAAMAKRVQSVLANPALMLRTAAFTDRMIARLAEVGLRPPENRRLTREDLDHLLWFENYEITVAVTAGLGGLSLDVARGHALTRRVNDLRRLVGFQRPGEDVFAAWRGLGLDLVEGRYDGVPPDVLSEAIARTAWTLADETIGQGLAPRLLKALDGTPETATTKMARLALLSQSDPDAVLRQIRDQVTPDALGTRFVLMLRMERVEEAVNWALTRHAADFNSIGVFHVLMTLTSQNRWPEALTFSEGITHAQKEERPILHALRGFIQMADALRPAARRQLLASPMPAHPKLFREQFDAAAPQLALRLSMACAAFADGERAALTLDRDDHVRLFQDLQTWLDLENPDRSARAQERLKQRLSADERFSSTIAFASVYGIEFDGAAARLRFETRLGLGGFELEDFRALQVLYEDAQERLQVVDRHQAALARFLGAEQAAEYRIEQLIQCDRLDEAEAAFAEAAGWIAESDNLTRLKAGLASKRGGSASEALEILWERNEDLGDLEMLCEALGREKRWPVLAQRAEVLAAATRDPDHIAMLCDAYNRQRLTSKVLATLDAYVSDIDASSRLKSMHALLLIRAGQFPEADGALQQLIAAPDRDEPDDDRLLLELALDRGDWEAISTVVERIWSRRETRSARRLIEGATLAMDRGLHSRAHELAIAATAKPDADAPVFMTAWMVGNTLDRDWPEMPAWISEALKRSGPEGPIWETTLEEAAEVLPKQQERRTEVFAKLNKGEAPLFVLGEALNLTLTDLVLGAAMRNAAEGDPRRRWLIPTIRGGRPPTHLAEMNRLAMDLTSLLVLQALNLIPAALERFVVVLPIGTLRTLFEERQQLQLHAPRRARLGAEALRLAGQGGLISTPLAASDDVELVQSVGEDMADLLEHGRRQGLRVCRPGPVPRPGSLRMEPVDMGAHMDVLCSTLDIARYLFDAGRIDALRFEAAMAQLGAQDTGWGDSAPLQGGDAIIVDDLALTFLQISGLLAPAIAAFGSLAIPAATLKEAQSDVEVGAMAEALFDQVDELRRRLRDGLAAGSVVVAPMPDDGEPDGKHPTFRLFRIEDVDAFVIDDRQINGVVRVTTAAGNRPMVTSLDVVEELGRAKTLSYERVKTAAANVMRSGFLFMPVTISRVLANLKDASASGKFVETADLRALREYLQRVRMAHRMVLPMESAFFEGVAQTVVVAIRRWWAEAPDLATAEAGATWLQALFPDPRALLQVWTEPPPVADAEALFVAQLTALLLPNVQNSDRMIAFGEWAERVFVRPLEVARPDLLSRVAHEIADRLAETEAEMAAANA